MAAERLAPAIHGVLRFFGQVLSSLSCNRRAAARGELLAARQALGAALAWVRLAHKAVRLAFKRRCWSQLGRHLHSIKQAGRSP